ncbi:MAG: hypothetical protein LUG60_01480 [Erysipelotrichaceae bacterium]|nr:hypothetical protein [Erysipelotrichaceae bacterium]
MKFKKVVIVLCLVFVLGIISSCDVDDTETSLTDETSEIETVDTNEGNNEVKDENTGEDESKSENNNTEVENAISTNDPESTSFIKAFNKKYPNEKITQDQLTVYARGTTIKVNDNITYEVSESDGSTIYNCSSNTKYNEKNKKVFFEYVDRMIDLGIYSISYNFSSDYPTSEYNYDETQKLYIWYNAREDGTEQYPTFEVRIYKKTW